MVKRKGRRGQKRKSGRTKAAEALKKAKKENNNNNSCLSREQNPEISSDRHNAALSPPLAAAEGREASGSRPSLPEPRRGRKKKRLDEVVGTSAGPTAHQNEEQAKHEVPPVNNGTVFPSKQQMPEKRILEFVLDILQRRDTHEIFAQPVDQNEVEGYYSIIREPMDFGTMRAKLQEEIYTTLEQFEKDVFLITNNAMLFNSSSTIYFRQARAIHELAKRVFHTLKTEPQKIELELSLTSRRYGRKTRGEDGSSHIKLGAKLRANNQSDPHENGLQRGKNVNFNKTGRRQMYAMQYSTVEEEESFISMVNSSSKNLVQGNGGIGYSESLLRFVGDLGPIAQKVARQKLRCLAQTPIPPISSPASQQPSSGLNGVMNTVNAAVKNPQDNLATIPTGTDSSIFRGRMEVELDRPNIPNAVSKGKGVLSGDGMDFYGGPICRETLPCSGNDGLDSLKYVDLGQGAIRRDGSNCSRNLQRQLCSSYFPDVQVQPSHCASVPQPELLEFFSSNSNRRPKSSVYPSTVIRPSRLSQPITRTALMHGPGQESSFSPVGQPMGWNLPTPWGPHVIVDFHANLLGNNRFKQQDPQLIMNQYGQTKSDNDSPLGTDGLTLHQRESQLASAAPYMQAIGVNHVGQDAVLQQELLSQSGYTQLQPSLLDLLGQGIFAQPNLLAAYELQGPKLVVPQYVQMQPKYANPVGRNAIPSQEIQLGLRHQGLMSDPQQTSNAELWNSQQQYLRGTTSHHPDLDLRLQTHNQRL